MNTWAHLLEALGGGLNEHGEAFVDNQALKILDRQVRGASDVLKQSEESLTEMVTKKAHGEVRVNQLNLEIKNHEGYAIKALEKNETDLAREIAEAIADLERQLINEKEVLDYYTGQSRELRRAIKQTERELRRLKRQVDAVRAAEGVQRAKVAIVERNKSEKKIPTAVDSLEKLKTRNSSDAERQEIDESETPKKETLMDRLVRAGIATNSPNAETVLERLQRNLSK